MRVAMVLLLLGTLAPGLAAQQAVQPVRGGSPAMEAPRPDHALEWVVPAPVGAAEEVSPAAAEAAVAQAAPSAVLDQGFWRQVLAGVIVTVVSTLILRAIL